MSKIAILTPTFFHYSGIDNVARQQALDHSKKGDKVTVFALDGDIKPSGYKVVLLGMPKSLFLQRIYRLFFFLDIAKISRTVSMLRGFDSIISHFYPMTIIAKNAKEKNNIQYVHYNHGIGYSSLFSNPLEKLYLGLFRFFNRWSLKNVDKAVSISKFMQKELKRETGIESQVIYNKIDDKRFKKGLDGKKVRTMLSIKKNEKMLLFVGRLSPHKNIHGLVDIFNKLNKKLNCKLVIAGKPTFWGYFKRLKKMAGKNILFVEDVNDEDLPYFYAACDLYVTASLWEGFNLPAAEAQSVGKKVVAFDVCSHPEIIKNGILVKEGDNEGFCKAVEKSLRDEK